MSKTTLATTGAKEAFKNAITVGQKYAAELAESEEFFKPIVMAMAIQELKQALTPEAIAAVQELEGIAMGFKTDKINEKYAPDTIRMCVIEAMLRGVSIVGNQFNIIKGNFYIARNGWEAKLRKAGCTQVVPTCGKPEDVLLGTPNSNNNRQITATFAAQATCMKDGKRYAVNASIADGVDGRIEVSAFGKDLQACIDGLKGKAEARILKKLYFLACDATELDDDESHVIVVEPVERIEEKPTEAKPQQPTRDELMKTFESSRKSILNQLRTLPEAQSLAGQIWAALANAKTVAELKAAWEEVQRASKLKDDEGNTLIWTKHVDEMCRFKDFRKAEVEG